MTSQKSTFQAPDEITHQIQEKFEHFFEKKIKSKKVKDNSDKSAQQVSRRDRLKTDTIIGNKRDLIYFYLSK